MKSLRSNITSYVDYDFKSPPTFSLTPLIISLHIFYISESLRVFSNGCNFTLLKEIFSLLFPLPWKTSTIFILSIRGLSKEIIVSLMLHIQSFHQLGKKSPFDRLQITQNKRISRNLFFFGKGILSR